MADELSLAGDGGYRMIRPLTVAAVILSLVLVPLARAQETGREVQRLKWDQYPNDDSVYLPESPNDPGASARVDGEGGGGGKGGGGNWILPAIVAGVIAVVAVDHALSEESDPQDPDPGRGRPADDQALDSLLGQGPQLPASYNMSAFAIRGLVKGGWPLVVDYEQNSPGPLQLRISARGSDIVTYPLDQLAGPGRHLLSFILPGHILGYDLKPALVGVTAIRNGNRRDTQADFRIFALGVGPRAVGSAAIEQLDFNPDGIRVHRGEKALYRFYSHSEFDNLVVEFLHVFAAEDGSHNRYVDAQIIPGGAGEDQWVGLRERRNWDGRDEFERVSHGGHKLHVRAWDDGGDWIGAWSDASVMVRD